jgi:magnesium-dependent phosphatase 1
MAAAVAAQRMLPRCVVFDLDNCVWTPELYELWGGGGAPFTALPCGAVRDRAGTKVELLGAVRTVLAELRSSPLWAGVPVCVASCCDEPAWAHECMSKLLGELTRYSGWAGGRADVEDDRWAGL